MINFYKETTTESFIEALIAGYNAISSQAIETTISNLNYTQNIYSFILDRIGEWVGRPREFTPYNIGSSLPIFGFNEDGVNVPFFAFDIGYWEDYNQAINSSPEKNSLYNLGLESRVLENFLNEERLQKAMNASFHSQDLGSPIRDYPLVLNNVSVYDVNTNTTEVLSFGKVGIVNRASFFDYKSHIDAHFISLAKILNEYVFLGLDFEWATLEWEFRAQKTDLLNIRLSLIGEKLNNYIETNYLFTEDGNQLITESGDILLLESLI